MLFSDKTSSMLPPSGISSQKDSGKMVGKRRKGIKTKKRRLENSKRRRKTMRGRKSKRTFFLSNLMVGKLEYLTSSLTPMPFSQVCPLLSYTQKCLTPHLYLINCDLAMVRKPSNTDVWLTVLIQYCLWQYFILIQQSRKMCLKCWLNKAWKYVQNEAIFVPSYFKISFSGIILNGSGSLFILFNVGR